MGMCGSKAKPAAAEGAGDRPEAAKYEDKPVVAGAAEEEEEEEDDEDDLVDEADIVKPANKGMRTSVSAEAYGEWNKKEDFTPPVYPKTDDQKTRLAATLAKSFMFRALTTKEMDIVIDAMEEVNATQGERMINLGDEGDFLFVIETGSLECRKEIDGVDTLLKTVEEGDVFGELALLYNCVRAANVDAKVDSILWKLDRKSFNNIVKEAAQKKRERYEGFLGSVPLLKSMDSYERSQLCDGLQSTSFAAGSTIISQGETGDTFFILESGVATATKDGAEPMKYGASDFFGELALLKNAPRAATVKAETDCECLSLDRGAFNRLFGGSATLLAEFEKHAGNY